MSLRRINERYTLIANKKTGVDALVDDIINNPDGENGKLFLLAKELKDVKLKRSYIESCFLASKDFDKISELLEIKKDILEIYAKCFYDLEGLDRLSKLELLDVKDKDEGVMKIWALSQGLDFISWRLGNKIDITPVDGLTELFHTCLYKSKEAMFNKNASEASKESTKWVKLSIEIARLLKVWVMDSAGARREIEIALKEVIPEFKGVDDLDGFDLNVNVRLSTSIEEEDKEDGD